jgi:3-hydroxyacyl-CoA dehydrogenase
MNRFQVKKVAVLGAGVMGAQIAAHLVNVKVPVVLFDLPAKEGPRTASSPAPSRTSRSSSPPRWAWRPTPT